MVHTHNPGTWKAKTGGLQVQRQPGMYNETLSQKENKVSGRNSSDRKIHK